VPVNALKAMPTTTSTQTAATEVPARRFSEGMERIPIVPSMLRIGRFSDGSAPTVTMSADRIGSFADGRVGRPDASAARRVGSFGDGYDAVRRSYRLRVQRPQATPAAA
jgi:hypothetical protein